MLPDRDVNFCEAVGYYDPALSETASELAANQTLRYGIGAANISYVRDSIGLPGSMSGPSSYPHTYTYTLARCAYPSLTLHYCPPTNGTQAPPPSAASNSASPLRPKTNSPAS